ncbi:MAG TPA: HAD family hydrolase [Anaerolineales bacterium]|nr:HAD family hydrolase [Anaerolineales bacterium]
MPRFFRAVVFDFGGTLMYGRHAWEPYIAQADETLTEYLRLQGMELNINTFPSEFRTRLVDYFNQREKDLLEATYSSVLRELLIEKGYGGVSSNVIREALDRLFSVTQSNWALEEDSLPTLQKLQASGYSLGLISNAGDDQDVQKLVRNFNIQRYFDFVLTSAACSYRKPHRRIFELALANWYLHPEEAVMVGDSLLADVQGAQKVGMYGVWLNRRADPQMEIQESVRPDASLSSLADLPALLDHLQVV